MIMLVLYWWVFEFMCLLSASFGVVNQASQIILMNIATLFLRPGLGFDQVTSALVGNCIGAGNYSEATSYYQIMLLTSLVGVLLTVLFQYSFSD